MQGANGIRPHLHLILSSAGTGNVPDVQELLADRFQLCGILDLKADGEHTPAARQIAAVQFLHPDTGGGHNGCHIQQQPVSGNAVQFQGSLERLLFLSGPADPNPAGCLPGIFTVGGVGTVGPVPNGGKDRNYAVTSNNASYVDITFCYATVFEGTPSIPSNHPLFKSAEIIENESDYTLRLHLRKKGGFYGWHAYYNDNGQLCFQFLHPAKASAATNKYGADLTGVTVMIDVGHGGTDGGAVAYYCQKCNLCWTNTKSLIDKKNCPTCKEAVQMHEEADRNLALANALKAELESVGATVILNRSNDKSININDRLRNLMETAPDICIAIHQNSYSDAKIGGFDTYYFTPWSYVAAKNIATYTKDTGIYTKSRYQWSVNYFMMRQTVCPVILTENGYMSNLNDLVAMVDPAKIQTKAEAIAHGVADYFLSINK